MLEIPTSEWHRVLLGSTPSARQNAIYDTFPTYRGVASKDQNSEVMEAMTILALRSGPIDTKVIILAPPAMEGWVLQEIDKAAYSAFTRCKRHPEQSSMLAKGYTRLFKKLILTGRVLQLPSEPTHWVSIGFSTEDILPEWMAGKLLIDPLG